MSEVAIWTAQQDTHQHVANLTSDTTCTKELCDNGTSHVQVGGDSTKRLNQGMVDSREAMNKNYMAVKTYLWNTVNHVSHGFCWLLAAKFGHMVAFGDGSGAFNQAPLDDEGPR